jgi:hypothetical protein
MSTRPPTSGVSLLLVLMLLVGCATGVPASGALGPGHRASGHYAQSTDSATAGCLRNPACYTRLPGVEGIIPWMSRAKDAAHAAVTWR